MFAQIKSFHSAFSKNFPFVSFCNVVVCCSEVPNFLKNLFDWHVFNFFFQGGGVKVMSLWKAQKLSSKYP